MVPSTSSSSDLSAPQTPVGSLDDTTAVLHGLFQAFSLIIFSEIGDKTFLIAAILAMRHPRLVVFLGAFSSLAVMSVLSAEMGHLLPALIPRRVTQFAAAVLFIVFGTKMWVEARHMRGGAAKMQEEMKEAEEEIEEDEAGPEARSMIPLEDMEEGHSPGIVTLAGFENRTVEATTTTTIPGPEPTTCPKKTRTSWTEGARNFCSLFFGPVFVQAFILTFLGEWGDRSQIATIALGAAHNVYLVAVGTVLGHSCCTMLAVIGGRYISNKISVKHVTYGGSILFLLFGLIYFYEAMSMTPDVDMPIPISVEGHS
ncbi:hypothetical protein APHAL10511_003010 [Amanita phalloides]|nr:hypothetical protein APHAL10511_003010 [Amanita phalloides]